MNIKYFCAIVDFFKEFKYVVFQINKNISPKNIENKKNIKKHKKKKSF